VTHGDQQIRVVYDTSAILAFVRGSIHAGELLAVVGEEGGTVGLPMACLAEANWMVGDRGMLDLLLDHYATDLIATPEDWLALGAMQDVTGLQDAASAALSAVNLECNVLSARPGLYVGMAGSAPVIPIPLTD
jgi:hypothetical protein